MKIALCFFGKPRNVKHTLNDLINKIITFNNSHMIDTFIHPWNVYNDTLAGVDINRKISNNFNENDIQFILDLLKPKNYLFEKQIDFKYEQLEIPKSVIKWASTMNKNLSDNENEQYIKHCNCSMFYSIMKVNQLMNDYATKNSIVYDIVIILRFDVVLKTNLDLNFFSKNTLFYFDIGKYPDNLFCDWSVICSHQISNIYSSVYNFIDFLNKRKEYDINYKINNTVYPDDNFMWGNEHFIREICDLFKINRKKISNNNIGLFY